MGGRKCRVMGWTCVLSSAELLKVAHREWWSPWYGSFAIGNLNFKSGPATWTQVGGTNIKSIGSLKKKKKSPPRSYNLIAPNASVTRPSSWCRGRADISRLCESSRLVLPAPSGFQCLWPLCFILHMTISFIFIAQIQGSVLFFWSWKQLPTWKNIEQELCIL